MKVYVYEGVMALIHWSLQHSQLCLIRVLIKNSWCLWVIYFLCYITLGYVETS